MLPTLVIHNLDLGPLTIGYNAGDTDNYSWYRLGGASPSSPRELAKISFILTFAMHLNNVRSRINEPKELAKLLLHLMAPILLIHIQGDDGTAHHLRHHRLLHDVHGGGLSWKYIIGALAAGITAVSAAFMFLSDSIGKSYQWYPHPGRDRPQERDGLGPQRGRMEEHRLPAGPGAKWPWARAGSLATGCSAGTITAYPTPTTTSFSAGWATPWVLWGAWWCWGC